VNNWGNCDHLCCGALGNLIKQYPELVSKRTKWAKSKNRWFKRAAAVSLIVPVKSGLLLDHVFKTADILLTDNDDMVQKGYGWMLKEAGSAKGGIFSNEVFAYVMKHKAVMPRTALRYAIEKLPPSKRKQAMA
jgi:3-methyladenine DNA glycosylase AlkD